MRALLVCLALLFSGCLAALPDNDDLPVEKACLISAGQAVTSNASGQAVAASAATVTVPSGTADAVAGTYNVDGGGLPQAVNGYALDDAFAAGQVIRVLLAA